MSLTNTDSCLLSTWHSLLLILFSWAFYTNNEQLCFQTHYASSSGTGLYPKASIFNHNCVPNAVYYTIDNVLVIHSSRQINAGEEVCFSYMQSSNLADSALFRNVHLDRDFICGCPKCTRDLTKRDIRLIKDPNAVDPAMGEVTIALSEQIQNWLLLFKMHCKLQWRKKLIDFFLL